MLFLEVGQRWKQVECQLTPHGSQVTLVAVAQPEYVQKLPATATVVGRILPKGGWRPFEEMQRIPGFREFFTKAISQAKPNPFPVNMVCHVTEETQNRWVSGQTVTFQ